MNGEIISIAKIDAPVLIIGEPGTEKKEIAKAIHQNSHRAEGPFAEFSCDRDEKLFSLMQSEEDFRRNALNSAIGGSLFLTEVHLLSADDQENLLQLLVKGVRAGKKISRKDIRVIAASTLNLVDPAIEVDFKRELVHRLNIHSISVPALREMRSEIPQLAEHYLEKYAKELNLPEKALTSQAKDKLMRYDWPGNIRELQDEMQKCLIQCKESVIDASQLDIVPSAYDYEVSFQDLKAKFLAHFEKDYIVRLITEHRGNISKAAHAAQMDRRYFYRLMKKYKIERREIVNRLKNHTISYKDIWEVNMGQKDDGQDINEVNTEIIEIDFEQLIEEDDLFDFTSFYEDNNTIG